jgi:hypothetical protein
MENVFFNPWVGEYYAANGFYGRKILVLGESHYCEDSENFDSDSASEFTIEVVQMYLDYKNGGKTSHKPWMNTFTHFTKMILGEPKNDEIIEFWDSAVFYNYVQKAMPRPNYSPSEDDFEDSAPAFFEVLKEHKPDLVIAWGDRLWRALPAENGVEGEPVLPGTERNFYNYTVDGKLIRACGIPHPSRPSSFDGYQYLQAALSSVPVATGSVCPDKIINVNPGFNLGFL